MPYPLQHKAQTRARIVAAARRLFNRRGFDSVSIDDIMAEAGLTRGGFYHHFKRKQDLYSEVVGHALTCRPGRSAPPTAQEARQLVVDYLSDAHRIEQDHCCPLVAFSSEAARSDDCVKQAYTRVLDSLIELLSRSLGDGEDARQRAMTMATLCVGGTMLAQAVDNEEFGREIRRTALAQALSMAEPSPPTRSQARPQARTPGRSRA